MTRLSLSFLGPFQATLDGQPISGFESAKVRALLAYLAVEAGRPHPRALLAGLLWPDLPQSSALANLRHALANLRQCIGDQEAEPPFLLIDREAIRWNAASDYALDVAAFERAMRDTGGRDQGLAPERDEPGADSALARCVPLYGGPFLDGFSLGDSAAFEEWVRLTRGHLQEQYAALLERLGDLAERASDLPQAKRYAERLVALDPLREEGQRRLMRALALGGERRAALAQYESCRKMLAEELGVEPEPETLALYEQIRSGRLVAFASPRVHVPQSPSALTTESGVAQEGARPLFVAREEELARLEGWLQGALQDRGRVGFVVGEPGSGKTLLLHEFARRAMEAHPELVMAWGACNAYSGAGDSFLPFSEILRLLTGDVEGQSAVGALSVEHARRLRALAPQAIRAVAEVGPGLMDALLPAASLVERARALLGDGPWLARLQEAMGSRPSMSAQTSLSDQAARVLQAVAQRQPLLLVLDDLQWADAGSINLLFDLGRRLAGPARPGPRILVLGAYRSEEVVERNGQPHPLQPVLLDLLGLWPENEVDVAQAEGRAFVEAWVDSAPNRLGPAFREALYQRTGGHALFTVELLRGLQQRGDLVRDDDGRWVEATALDWERLSRRVEAVIAAHIARLPHEEQELLTVASVEGEAFHAEVAARVLGRSEGEVVAALSGALSQGHRLLRAESLRRVGEQSFSCYRFRHYLFQHYLYQRLDPVRRAHLHGKVAEALQVLGAAPPMLEMDIASALADDYSAIYENPDPAVSEAAMGWHWEEAGMAERAALYHAQAGRRAIHYSLAYEDIAARFTHVLDLLAMLPETPGRLLAKERTYHAVAWAQYMANGCMCREAGENWDKALDLAERLGDRLLIADALNWVSSYHRQRDELDLAQSLYGRALALAHGGLPEWVLQVEGNLALVLLHRGEFARAAQLLSPLSEDLVHLQARRSVW